VFRPSAGNDDCPDPNGFYSHYAGNRGEEVENVLNARSKKSRASRQFDLDIGSALCRG
jgi:hypothetical protein